MTGRRDVYYHGIFGDKTGFALASTMDAAALATTDVEFRCVSLYADEKWGFFGRSEEPVRSRLVPWQQARLDRGGIHLVRATPEMILHDHTASLAEVAIPVIRTPDTKLVLLTVFEAPRVPSHWPPLMDWFDVVVLPAEWQARLLREARPDLADRIRVIPHAFDIESTNAAKTERENALRPRELEVLATGTYFPRKGLDDAVKAVGATGRSGTKLTTHAHCFNLLHAPVLELSALHAGLAGRFHNETADFGWDDLLALYARADVMLAPAHAEGVGYSLLMAQALGLPVIALDTPGHRDTIPQPWAWVPAKDVAAGEVWKRSTLAEYDPKFLTSGVHPDDPWREPIDGAFGYVRELWRLEAARPTMYRLTLPRPQTLERHSLQSVGTQFRDLLRDLGG